jgi:methylated-DNA-[protein]-cysteine S-methyltransferase
MAAEWHAGQLYRFTFGHGTRNGAWTSLGAEADLADDISDDGDEFARRMQRFASGQTDDFRDISLALERFTGFQRRVLERCRRIPAGQTRTYQELAREAGCPGAARAVGNVMAANPFPLIVPCHRVVAAAGGLGGYSGPTGLAMKRRLLAREGATLPRPRN